MKRLLLWTIRRTHLAFFFPRTTRPAAFCTLPRASVLTWYSLFLHFVQQINTIILIVITFHFRLYLGVEDAAAGRCQGVYSSPNRLGAGCVRSTHKRQCINACTGENTDLRDSARPWQPLGMRTGDTFGAAAGSGGVVLWFLLPRVQKRRRMKALSNSGVVWWLPFVCFAASICILYVVLWKWFNLFSRRRALQSDVADPMGGGPAVPNGWRLIDARRQFIICSLTRTWLEDFLYPQIRYRTCLPGFGPISRASKKLPDDDVDKCMPAKGVPTGFDSAYLPSTTAFFAFPGYLPHSEHCVPGQGWLKNWPATGFALLECILPAINPGINVHAKTANLGW